MIATVGHHYYSMMILENVIIDSIYY